MKISEVQAAVEQLAALRQERDGLERRITALEDSIKAHMGERQQMDAGDYWVRWTHVESRRFDLAAFKKAHRRLYEQYSKPVESRRFTLGRL